MFLDICLGSKASWRILLLLTSSPGRGVSRQEIKKFTNLGGFALDSSLLDLVSFNIALENKIGKKIFYKINKTDAFSEEIIKICELEKEKLNNLYLGETLCLREFVRKAIDTKIEIHKILLFGSRVKGTYREDSDYDVCIIFNEKQTKHVEVLFTEIEDSIEKRFKKKIQMHFFYKDEFESARKKENKLAMEILRDGIELL